MFKVTVKSGYNESNFGFSSISTALEFVRACVRNSIDKDFVCVVSDDGIVIPETDSEEEYSEEE